jgi:hypothetical protein
MSTWRTETINNSEKSGALVIDKKAVAARALGWPEQIADATHRGRDGILSVSGPYVIRGTASKSVHGSGGVLVVVGASG